MARGVQKHVKLLKGISEQEQPKVETCHDALAVLLLVSPWETGLRHGPREQAVHRDQFSYYFGYV